MPTTLPTTAYATRLAATHAHALALSAAGALDDATLRRLADVRAVAAFRLLPQPRDPVEHVHAGYAFMRAHLERLVEHDPARPAQISGEDGYVYTFRPRTVLRRVLDHALDHLNQLEQWMTWRAHGTVPTPTDGWASSEDVLAEDSLPLSPADLAAWLWRTDLAWGLLAQRAAQLAPAELEWSPPGDDWSISRMLHHVAEGFYVVWLDEAMPEESRARFEHASRRLGERLRELDAQPLGQHASYSAQWGQPATLDDILGRLLDAERELLAQATSQPTA
jgi:hypothetical protein